METTLIQTDKKANKKIAKHESCERHFLTANTHILESYIHHGKYHGKCIRSISDIWTNVHIKLYRKHYRARHHTLRIISLCVCILSNKDTLVSQSNAIQHEWITLLTLHNLCAVCVCVSMFMCVFVRVLVFLNRLCLARHKPICDPKMLPSEFAHVCFAVPERNARGQINCKAYTIVIFVHSIVSVCGKVHSWNSSSGQRLNDYESPFVYVHHSNRLP